MDKTIYGIGLKSSDYEDKKTVINGKLLTELRNNLELELNFIFSIDKNQPERKWFLHQVHLQKRHWIQFYLFFLNNESKMS